MTVLMVLFLFLAFDLLMLIVAGFIIISIILIDRWDEYKIEKEIREMRSR